MHQESMAVAYVAKEHETTVPSLGAMGTRQYDSDKRLCTLPSKSPHRIFVYAAGPYGYWLSRDLSLKGHVCGVVAPSLMPKQASARVKTDRRDAVPWARLMRSGDLTPVDVPAVEDDAMRDLSREREAALSEFNTAKCRLKAFLLRHDSRDPGRATWGAAHRRWLSKVVGPTPARPSVCQEDVRAVTDHPERLQRLDQERHAQGHAWRLCPVVEARQALCGVPWTVAVTTVADRGDLTRCEPPRPLMPYLGLTPSA